MAKRSNNNSAGRRPHGDKPYDLNNSFVKKMATKMGEMIPQRSWISKWFNSPGANGNLFMDHGTHDDEIIEEEAMLQPPTKRPRIRMDVTHPPGTFSIQPKSRNQQEEDTSELHESLTAATAGPSSSHSFVASTPAMRTDIRNSNTILSSRPILIPQTRNNGSTINGNDGNSESGDSTSGCSSLIPQMSRQDSSSDHQNYMSSQFVTRKNIIDNKLNSFANNLQSPRSLLLLDSMTRDSMSARRPSFSVSIMNNNNNNNNNNNDSTTTSIDIDTNSILSSPFYTGNTTFGGANAIERSRKNLASAPGVSQFQLKVPRRSSVQVKPSNTSIITDSSGMSQTAKRIFEALENFSSPISDAKKIPIKTPGSYSKKRQRDETFDLTSTTRVGLRHLTRELAVPTVPDMLKLKRRQRLQDTTLAARKIISANSGPPPSASTLKSRINSGTGESQEYHLRNDDDSSKFLGKLRTKTNIQKHSTVNIEQPVEEVNLPNIVLPITSLPKFDIPLPKPNNSHITITNKTTINSDDSKSPSKIRKIESFKFSSSPSSSNTVMNFEFSSPIRLGNNINKDLSPINDFTFSSPINAQLQDNKSKLSTTTTTTTPTIAFGKKSDEPSMNFVWSGTSTAPRPKTTSSNSKLQTESFKQNIELKSGSVMDILGNKNGINEGNLWECSECFIKNNDNIDVCMACKVSKHKSSLNKKNTSSLNNILQSSGNDSFKFKMTNESTEKKSQTSEKKNDNLEKATPLPTQENTIFGKGKFDDSVMDKFKPAIDSWECPGCMLRNPGSIITCPCCNATKPGLLKTTPDKPKNVDQNSKIVTPSSSISSSLSTTQQPLSSSSLSGFGDKFKKPAGAWSCDSCMVQNKADVSECVACGGLKPGATPNTTTITTTTSTTTSTTTTEKASLTSFSGFGDKFKKPTGAWTCDSCMVQNKADVSECVACGGLKPGATPTTKSTASDSTIKFSFGIPAEIKTTESSTSKIEMPTNGFTFGIPASSSQTTQSSFSFGIPAATKATESSGFTFAAPKKINDFKEADKTEVSTIKPTGFTFNTPTEVKKVHEVEEPPKEKIESVINTPTTSSTQLATTSSVTSIPSTPLFTSANNTNNKSNEVMSFGQLPVSTLKKDTSSNVTNTTSAIEPAEKTKNTLFSFGSSSNKVSTASIFGEKQPEASKTSLPSFGTTTSTSKTPTSFGVENKLPSFGTIGKADDTKSLFKTPATFGASVVTTAVSSASTFGWPSNSPLFSASSSNTTTTTTSTSNKPSTANIFGSTSSVESTTNTPASNPGLFTFGSSANTQTNKPAQSTTGFQFNTQQQPSNNFSTFGTSVQAQNSNNFTFGNNSTPSATPASSNPAPFAFNAGSNTAPTSDQKSSTIPASSGFNSFSSFGSTTPANSATPAQFSFNPPKTSATPAFGQSTGVPNVFGNSQPSAPSTFRSIPLTNNTGFNFNTSTSVPNAATPIANTSTGGFNFSSAAPSTGGFNFNAPNPAQPVAFDPNSKPSFNFTGGSAPTAFMATPQATTTSTSGTRKIKKAVRRIQPR